MSYTPETYEIEEIMAIHIALDKAAENMYLLSTSQVKTIIGVKPKGTVHDYGAFTFCRSKYRKIGHERCWVVKRVIDKPTQC